MLGFTQISNTINNLLGIGVKTPTTQLPRVMLVSSMINRPGLSTLSSTSNILNKLGMVGINIGKMPDGGDNLTASFVYTLVDEIYRALKFDAAVQVGMQPGTLTSIGTGGNAGGPVTVVSDIVSTGIGHGAIR